MTDQQKARHAIDLAGGVIALVLCGLLGFALFALVRFDVRPTNHDILLVVITFLTAKISTIVDYYYSSSASSKQQQSTIASLAAASNAPPEAPKDYAP